MLANSVQRCDLCENLATRCARNLVSGRWVFACSEECLMMMEIRELSAADAVAWP